METSPLSPTLSCVSVDDIEISAVSPVPTSNTRLSPSNVVVNPRYLSFHVLPNKIKKQAVEILLSEKLPLDDWWQYSKDEKAQGSIGFKNIIDGLNNDNYYSIEEKQKFLKEFVQFTKDLDKIRNTDIKEVVPQLKEIFEKTYETV